MSGIVRRIDDLGRIVIPKELRRQLSLSEGDPMEMLITEDDEILLRKYEPVSAKAKTMLEALEPVHQYLMNIANEWLQMEDKRKYETANIQVYNHVEKELDDLEAYIEKIKKEAE